MAFMAINVPDQTATMPSPELGSGHEAARVHHASLRCGAASPLVARAQQSEPVRRVAVLMNTAADDVEGRERISAFLQRLQGLGWTEGQNVHVDTRWASGMSGGYRKSATELVNLNPEVILANGTPAVAPLLEATATIPIIFV